MTHSRLATSLLAVLIMSVGSLEAQGPTANYWVYVAAESADLLHLVRFGPDGAEVEKTILVGELPVETEGPHGLRMSSDGRYLYMTTGHGIPDGKLWKIETGPDTVVAEPILLGRFPATIAITPDDLYAFIVNFNLHGEKEPSSVSVVYTPELMEVAQTITCIQPHGARLHPMGTRLYSACVADDQIVEIDTETFEVSRRFNVAKGHEGPLLDYDPDDYLGRGRDGGAARRATAPTCAPTWALPTPSGDRIFVACNGGDRILEIDYEQWTLRRQIQTGRGPYNLAITPDGKTLVATLKQGAAVQFFDVETGESRGIAESSTTVTHGVVISPDSRYAFVTVEGVGAEPGKVDIYDLATLERVADVPVAQQAGGIAFWKMEEAR
ncbi:MAG: YncE family protein [Gemmatimonadetes bacterium]|nr:YncE family protein [Gemmatimonadota bacterium]